MVRQVFEHITYEVERGRARITLNRPEKRNALSIELVEELRAALWEADDDKAVHCVILKGAGTSFCSGYDLTPSRSVGHDGVDRRKGRGMDDDAWHIERFQRCLRTLTEMHKPSIAQIHGHCYAGGTDLALYCDLLICSDTASFGYSALRNMGAAPNQMWLYHIGPQWTKRLLLTGDTISGADAAKIGLVLKSVPDAYLEQEVEGLADRLSWIDAEMLSTNKRIVMLGWSSWALRYCNDSLPKMMLGRTLLRQQRTFLNRLPTKVCGPRWLRAMRRLVTVVQGLRVRSFEMRRGI